MASLENAHALIVGIANYQRISPLPDVVLNDAQCIRDVLVDPHLGGYPPDPTRVRLLKDAEATRRSILNELESLARRADDDSVVFLYFSCHGGQITSGRHAGEYLFPVETDLTTDETLAATAISGIEMTRALELIRSRKTIIIFDCCHSSGVGIHKAAGMPTVKTGTPDEHLAVLGTGRGWAIMASARESELSYILPNAAHSLFTEHLLAGLKGETAGGDEFVRVFSLFEYVQPRVTRARRTQHPVFKSKLEENFAVALRLGGRKGAVPRDDQGFRFDAYISYVNQEPDSTYVWNTLVPKLEAAGLKVAVSNDSEDPGVAPSWASSGPSASRSEPWFCSRTPTWPTPWPTSRMS